MGENTLNIVRYLFSFDLAVGENFSHYNNIVLPGIYSQDCWQKIQRQGQILSMERINRPLNHQSVNHNFQQQTNRIP